ncbi:MAG: hypothetical protein IH955_00770 [Chloroflexi bacterium]|nr:hypothetical protein [Chloroflexota bacterium]
MEELYRSFQATIDALYEQLEAIHHELADLDPESPDAEELQGEAARSSGGGALSAPPEHGRPVTAAP